jgi:excisionase family DNA binding protein
MTLQPARTDVEPLIATSRRNGSLLTARDVAELLGVPVSWVSERSRSGRIPTVTLGRYRRYRREAIEEWVRELEAEVG